MKNMIIKITDPELIEKVSKRLETIDRLERKYGPSGIPGGPFAADGR